MGRLLKDLWTPELGWASSGVTLVPSFQKCPACTLGTSAATWASAFVPFVCNKPNCKGVRAFRELRVFQRSIEPDSGYVESLQFAVSGSEVQVVSEPAADI